MALNSTWLGELKVSGAVLRDDEILINGIPLELPLSQASPRQRERQWQRRILVDIMPESPVGDAPEKTPLRILDQLTSPIKAARSMEEVLQGQLEPLRPVFLYSSRQKFSFPIAFHVLAVKGKGRSVNTRAMADRSFRLLCRNSEGVLNKELIGQFIERFRLSLDHLDLAQSALLSQIQPGWSPEQEPKLFIPEDSDLTIPFLPSAAKLLQRDLRTLLSVDLTSADFFQHVNLLLAVHFGLYQPRLARHLNPAMDALLAELAEPNSQDVEVVKELEQGKNQALCFDGSISLRVPFPGEERPVSMSSPEYMSFQKVRRDLNALHFNLLLFHRTRMIVRDYLRGQGYEEASLADFYRFPSDIIGRLQDHPDFRDYFERASEALCLRFEDQQIDEANKEKAASTLSRAPTGLHALWKLYQIYNLQHPARPGRNRAYAQGFQVLVALLSKSGEYGLVRSRPGIGAYFELGSGLLPVLMLFILGRRERIRLHQFWSGLAEYGLRLEERDRRILLRQLKAMGMYERFSDAGEASYVRNPVTFKSVEGGSWR